MSSLEHILNTACLYLYLYKFQQCITTDINNYYNQDEATMAKSLYSSVDNPLDRLPSLFWDLLLDSLLLDSRT